MKTQNWMVRLVIIKLLTGNYEPENQKRNSPFRQPGYRQRLAPLVALWLCAPALLPVCPFEDVKRQAKTDKTRDTSARRENAKCRKTSNASRTAAQAKNGQGSCST
jgi:hypothetical protein